MTPAPGATLLALALALGAWPAAAPAESFEVEAVAAVEGQPRIILARRPGLTATVSITFAAGSVDDGDQHGLTRLAQQSLLAGNRRIDLERLLLGVHASAGDLAIGTQLRVCSFTLTADRRDFLELARQLVTGVLSPQLDPRRHEATVARAMLDTKQRGGGAGLLAAIATLVVNDTRYLNEPFGDRDSLEALTFDDVKERVGELLTPANATVVVTGAFDRDEVLRFLRTFRGGRAAPATRPSLALPFRTRRRSPQETHVLAYQVGLQTPRQAAAVQLASALLYDELWRTFRQAGVGYSFQVEPVRSAWLDALIILLPARDPSTANLAPHLQAAVQRVRSGGYDDGQLERARGAALGRFGAVDRDSAELARVLSEGGPTWHGQAVASELRLLDRAALTDVLGQLLTPERSISIYLGPTP
jgi:hypothetical protein